MNLNGLNPSNKLKIKSRHCGSTLGLKSNNENRHLTGLIKNYELEVNSLNGDETKIFTQNFLKFSGSMHYSI